MAKAAPITGLLADMPAIAGLRNILAVRIDELWSWGGLVRDPKNASELHDMRIAAKRLRYCLEFFNPLFGDGSKPILAKFKYLQDFLGEIHDCDVWVEMLHKMLRKEQKRAGRVGGVGKLNSEATSLQENLSDRRDRLFCSFVDYWDGLDSQGFKDELLGIADLAEKRMVGMSTKAAIDIGSNSIKLLALKIFGDGSYEIVHDEYMVTGLGSGLVAGGNLQPEAVEKSLQCIAKMVATAKAHGVGEVVAAGTAALRKAADSAVFISQVYQLSGIRVQVICPDDEARLSRAVALREIGAVYNPVVFFDIGGGSTELTWCEGVEAKRVELMPMGARQLTEVAKITHPVSQDMEDTLKAYISIKFAKHEVVPPGTTLVSELSPKRRSYLLAGLGGTAVTLTRLLKLDTGGGAPGSHIVSVQTAQIKEILDQLRSMTIGQVETMLDFDAARAPVIFAGAFLLNELLARFKVDEFRLVDRGLRFGLLLGD